jgi:hypothetical protein
MPTVLERFQDKLGDPKQALKHKARQDRDIRYLLSHMDGWRSEHPNRWIAVYNENLVAVADSQARLLRQLATKRISLREALIDFVTEQPMAFVL